VREQNEKRTQRDKNNKQELTPAAVSSASTTTSDYGATIRVSSIRSLSPARTMFPKLRRVEEEEEKRESLRRSHSGTTRSVRGERSRGDNGHDRFNANTDAVDGTSVRIVTSPLKALLLRRGRRIVIEQRGDGPRVVGN